MHAGELYIDETLVSGLLTAQFPIWAGLRVERVASSGTDNALFRLGGDLVARLPRVAWAAGQPEKEFLWLPKLGPNLSLAVSEPVVLGQPASSYPWHWTVCRWIDGHNATLDRIENAERAAEDLARFIVSLRRIDAVGGPVAGEHNSFRGVPLAQRDKLTHEAISALGDILDVDAMTVAWDRALAAPPWNDPPVWVHGDLQSGNLLAANGHLTAVIDFGCLGVGDPACDMLAAWNLFPAAAREVFRKAVAVDDSTWERGRGWALSIGVIALAYYRQTNPVLAGINRRAIDEVLAG